MVPSQGGWKKSLHRIRCRVSEHGYPTELSIIVPSETVYDLPDDPHWTSLSFGNRPPSSSSPQLVLNASSARIG